MRGRSTSSFAAARRRRWKKCAKPSLPRSLKLRFGNCFEGFGAALTGFPKVAIVCILTSFRRGTKLPAEFPSPFFSSPVFQQEPCADSLRRAKCFRRERPD